MLPKEGALLIVSLLVFFACVFSPFYLSEDTTLGVNRGVRKALTPVFQEYVSLQSRADAKALSGKEDPALVAARSHLTAAERYNPAFETETVRHADNHARAAMEAYADAVEQLADARAAGTLPVEGPDTLPGETAHRLMEANDALTPTHPPTARTRIPAILFPAGWLLVLPCIFLVGFGPMALHGLRSASVRRRGVPMTGTVISVAPLRLMKNFQPQYLATVRLPTGETTTVTVGSFVGVPEGMELPLLVLPNDHSRAVLAK